jgi:flagellar biogenesis protein FliO
MHSLRKPFPFKAFIGPFFLFLLAFSCMFAAEEPNSVEASIPETTNTQQEPLPFGLEGDKVVDDETTHFFNEFIKMLGTLGLLIAVMIFSSWVLKGMLNKQKQKIISSDSIKVLERCQLSHNGFIYLIEVDNKTLLIGESAQNINLLTNLSENPEREV